MITQAVIWAALRDAFDNGVIPLVGSGAPTDGTTGAGISGPGSLYIDYTNKISYWNIGTLVSPVWSSSSIPALGDITASGAVTVTKSGTYRITKAGVAALTIAAPAAAGLRLVITSDTAFAHTLTSVGLFQTGGPNTNVLTFNAFAGATVELFSTDALKWKVGNQNGVAFTS